MMRRKTFASLAVVVLLALAGCGGDGKSPSAKEDDAAKMRKFAQCMRANGVDVKDPVDGRVEIQGKPGDDQKRTAAAQKKCQHLMPDGGKPRKPNAQELAKMRALAKCMRAHGINMPDPKPDGEMSTTQMRGDGNEAKLKAAMQACRKYRPTGPPKGKG